MANNVKFSFILAFVTLGIVHSSPQISLVRKCREIDHTIYLKRSSILKCPQEEVVNLSNLKLTKIQPNIVKSGTIENLLLDRNNIREIPDDLFKYMPKLKCIDLSRNEIMYNKLTIKSDNLKTLILDYQTLHRDVRFPWKDTFEISKISSNFPNLEVLSISGNIETSVNFPIDSLSQLSSLYAADKQLAYVEPNFLENYPQLKSLHLEGNKIRKLHLQHTANLEELYLDRNPIEDIDLTLLNNVKILSLSNCSMEYVGFINSPNLITLDLSYNRITEISNDIFKHIPVLENLNLKFNNIRSMPYLRYLIRLKTLFLSYNSISTISTASLPNTLKTLSLKGNEIRKLEMIALRELTELEELDLSSNLLESLPVGWMDNLKMLRYLNLMSNRFTMISDIMLYRFSNLQELCLVNNFIGNINVNSLQILPKECTVYILPLCNETGITVHHKRRFISEEQLPSSDEINNVNLEAL